MRRLLLAVLLAMPLAAHAASLAEVIPGVHLLRGGFTPGSQPDGNTVIFEAPEGLVVVDTGRHAAHTSAILEFAKESGRPIVAVVNTHWHLDHIGGNAAIRAAHPGVRIYASGALASAREGFLADYRKQLASMVTTASGAQRAAFEAEIALIDGSEGLAPDVVISRSETIAIGGAKLAAGLEPRAVTAGDVWLRDAGRGLVVAGDLVTLPAPFLDTACPARWMEALARLDAAEFDLLIPGHGAPMTKRQFGAYRKGFGELLACAAGDAKPGSCIDGWLAAAEPLGVDDTPFTRALTDYYVTLLRDGAKLRSNCP